MNKHNNLNKTQKTTSSTDQQHIPGEKGHKPELFMEVVSQLMKLSQEYTDLVNNSIASSANRTNARAELAEEIFNQVSSSMNSAIQQNMVLAKDLLNCKDIKDITSFQQKFLENHCPNIINSYATIIQKIQEFEKRSRFTKK